MPRILPLFLTTLINSRKTILGLIKLKMDKVKEFQKQVHKVDTKNMQKPGVFPLKQAQSALRYLRQVKDNFYEYCSGIKFPFDQQLTNEEKHLQKLIQQVQSQICAKQKYIELLRKSSISVLNRFQQRSPIKTEEPANSFHSTTVFNFNHKNVQSNDSQSNLAIDSGRQTIRYLYNSNLSEGSKQQKKKQ